MDQLPPLNRLYHTTANLGTTVHCARSRQHPRSDALTPALVGTSACCSRHRDEDPTDGWMWVYRAEWELLVLLRNRGVTETTLNGLRGITEAVLNVFGDDQSVNALGQGVDALGITGQPAQATTPPAEPTTPPADDGDDSD